MRRLLSLVGAALLLAACQPSFGVYDLRCEGLVEPLGIDSAQPRFSWKIRSDQPMEQVAYEIEVGPGLWQSGKVESSDQVMVPYGGLPLYSRQQAWWRVRVWDAAGKTSAWSPKQRFGIGVLDGLQGDFIGAVPGEGRQPVFRKVFTVDKAVDAVLHVTSLGYHEVYFNGKKVSGEGPQTVLLPAVSQLDKRSLIVTYSVNLRKGENELLIYAGTGWYKPATFGVVYDGPLVKAELDVDGVPYLWTDDTWQGAWSGRKDLGTWQPHRFGGEWIQAAVEPEWGPVDYVAVEGVVSTPMMCPPIRVQEMLEPISVEKRADGSILVDFGRIVNAMLEMGLPQLPAGSVVTATFSDYLHPDGTLEEATQGQDIYVASGAAGDHFFNRFNHHLMRYMVIEGLPEPPKDIRAYRIGDDVSWSSSFESSDPDLNAIYGLVETSVKNLTFGGYMVDCASIERLGYGGDGNASTQTLQSMADVAPLYLNWLQAWADAQRPDGGLPHTAPNPYTAGGGPYWCSFPVQAAWRTYWNYGDIRPLERFYPVMKHWLDYADAYTVDGLLKAWPNESYRGWYLGDWAAPEGVDVDDPASIDLVSNCTLCQVYLELEQIAQVLGEEDDAEVYRERYDALRQRIQEVLYHDGIYASGSQVDMVFPLLTGVVPEELEPSVVTLLKERTQEVYGGHLATGLVGVPIITEWATKAGECDWLYGLLKQPGYPGYLYMLENGATGVWEEWDGGRSHLHNCYNGIGSWFYEALGGIRALEPGYRRVRIAPQAPEGLEWVKVTQETPYGPITVHRQGKQLQVSIPVGVTAEIDGKTVGSGEYAR
ncbi:MAG: family 78 glycoside hydrolase catalytic domain [Bacteroidales bacterium]|nr:family 78 glycoside hydrolase catalytic domain [Bacteroidales bacterium]